MDRIAEALGLDPVAAARAQRAAPRRHDGDRPGAAASDAQRRSTVLREAVDALATSGRKRARLARARSRGIGLSLFFHGAGFTGGGEVRLASLAALELTAARRPRILVAQHRDRPGHAHDARADRGRDARRCRSSASRSPSPTPPACPTAARPWPRAPAWWSAACCARCARRADASGSARTSPPAAYLRAARAAARRRRSTSRRPASPGTTPPTAATPTPPTAGAATWSRSSSTRRPARCGRRASPRWSTIGKAIHPLLARRPDRGRHARRASAARCSRRCVMKDGRMANAQLTNYIIPTDARRAADRRRRSSRTRTRTGRSAPRASASCRWTAPARRVANAVAPRSA